MWTRATSATNIHTILKDATAQSLLGFILRQLAIISAEPVMLIIWYQTPFPGTIAQETNIKANSNTDTATHLNPVDDRIQRNTFLNISVFLSI